MRQKPSRNRPQFGAIIGETAITSVIREKNLCAFVGWKKVTDQCLRSNQTYTASHRLKKTHGDQCIHRRGHGTTKRSDHIKNEPDIERLLTAKAVQQRAIHQLTDTNTDEIARQESCTLSIVVCRSDAIQGNPGRYMSTEKGLTVASDPRIRIIKYCLRLMD